MAEQASIKVTDPCAPLDCAALYDLARPLEVEIGCGKGRFLTSRARRHPEREFLGIERMLERVRCFSSKVERLGLSNIHVVRLEALYTLHYMIPDHHISTCYVFFPDPWPKRRHRAHRLFNESFLKTLWMKLETGGTLQFATDHAEYFEYATQCVDSCDRFIRTEPMERTPDEWTEFETKFRAQGLKVHAAAWKAVNAPEIPFEPLKVPVELEPKDRDGEN